jgi:predicted component of type VI protein secretion system
MSELIIRTGKHAGKKLLISEPEITIGRDETCRIRVASGEVSRRHCVIMNSPSGLVVRDLKSGNGTFVNDQPIEQETALEAGDVVRIGPLELQVPGKKKNSKKSQPETSIFSEDDIANWLADEDEGESAGGSTTIIRHRERPSAPAPAAQPKKQFRSIAEEAADIIRRHWETVGKDEEEE